MEPKYCASYHEYIIILNKARHDSTLPITQKLLCNFLHNRISNYHYEKCVKPEFY